MAIDGYTKWRNIASQSISGDGKWDASILQLTDAIAAESKPVLHVINLKTNIALACLQHPGPFPLASNQFDNRYPFDLSFPTAG